MYASCMYGTNKNRLNLINQHLTVNIWPNLAIDLFYQLNDNNNLRLTYDQSPATTLNLE